ncbi:MAG: GNAT family N-acetyltransferase, partial [Gammaproteobacteria bacterium]
MPDVHAVMRPAQPEDAAGIQALFTDEEESFRVYPEGQFPLTVDQVERLIKKRTEPTVLEIDGRIAGFSGLYSYKEGSSAFIGNVIIDRQFRGRGLGKQLMEYMIDRGFR